MKKMLIILIFTFIGLTSSKDCRDKKSKAFCEAYKNDCSNHVVKRFCQKTCGLCDGGGGGGGCTGPKKCDVAIVGGGLSGLYMAESLLRHGKETQVCVFERDERLGGRILDHVFLQVPNVTVGLGAWRIDMAHNNMREILLRLNIPSTDWDFYSNPKTETRGIVSRDEQEIKRQSFPTLTRGMFKNMSHTEMLDYLLKPEHLESITKFATFETFQHHFLTPEGSRFYFDIFGYDGDLKGSPEGVVEYYRQLTALTGKEIRPLKGMSAIIEALALSARTLGAKILAGHDFRILSIDKKARHFLLKTSKYEIKASKLVVAAPPGSFEKVSGCVAQRIQRTREFQSILARPAFKGAAVYPSAWWEEKSYNKHRLYPMERFLSNSDCLGWTLPHSGSGLNGEAVLHVSYNDGVCGEKWGEILKLPKTVVDQEIHRALEYKFQTKIPTPLSTVYQYWNEGAWYLQKPGSYVSMKEVEEWAKRPFRNEPIFVIGSAYHPYRGYSEGAIISADNALNEGWNIMQTRGQTRITTATTFSKANWRNIR
ncbi:LOW QUALITY PROTEIN: flavin-dependent L-tryptophan oxidase VioA-like [Montipora capricornis]|uniref:LOW QUALITY PROTEIN: flavin-dependent L-tryptophan oxidase VioA-like n=1 Tax=Montipora capricornis TaxID=246305 RepID=UPI0035F1920A